MALFIIDLDEIILPLLQLKNYKFIILLVKAAFLCLLLGRAWQHFFWTTPYAAVLPLENGHILKQINLAIGCFLLGGVVVGMLYTPKQKWQTLYIYGILIVILLLSVSYWVVKDYRINQLFEYSIQVGAVWLMILVYSREIKLDKIKLILRVLIAFTFTAHGLYAIGFPYSTPAGFIEMVSNILQTDNQSSMLFLKLAGFMDLVLSVGLFYKTTEKTSLVYAFFWGLATALARTVAYFDALSPFSSIHRWFYETVHRMPHAIFPLILLAICGYIWIGKEKVNSEVMSTSTS